MRARSKSGKKRGTVVAGGGTPTQQTVTAYPSAVSTSPVAAVQWVNSANLFADDGSLAQVNFSGGGVTSAVHVEGFGFQDDIPVGATIDAVVIEFEARHDAPVTDADARPQVSPRINSVASPGSWAGPATGMTTSLALYTADVTGHPNVDAGVAWGSTVWTRAMLIDGAFQLGVRSRNVGSGTGDHWWDFARVKVTYTTSSGPPPAVRHLLTAGTVGTTGKVTGPGIDTSAANPTEDYPEGTNVPLVPTPTGGSVFQSWQGDAAGSANPLIVGMNAPKTINASFSGTPSGDPVEAHWGSVLKQDLGTAVNGRDVWLGQSTPGYSDQHVSESVPYASDPYVQRIAETGLWTPHNAASPSTHYRRMIAPVAPPQAIYDSHVAGKHWPEDENATTRCQFQRWSSSSAFYVWTEGDHNWIVFGFRLQTPSVHLRPVAPGGGNNYFSQLVQWKVRHSNGFSEVDSFGVGTNGVKCKFDNHVTGTNYEDMIPCSLGTWHRIAIEKYWSSNASLGYYTVWGRLEGATTWSQLTPKRFISTLIPGGYGNMGFGPYHDIRLCTNNQLYHCDYRDFQVIDYV